METVIADIREILKDFTEKIKSLPDTELSAKPHPEKWSKKEVLGHLIDSAQSNLRRFVIGQYEDRPTIVYDQDAWVRSNNYQGVKKEDVIELWRLINERICAVLDSMPRANYSRHCNTSKGEPEYKSLEWLATDYVKHMKHHLNQILAGSFDVVYP